MTGNFDQIAAKRITATGLSRPERTIPEVVRHLCAVQAQLLFGAQMALINRSNQDQAGFKTQLDQGDLVISWLNRGTLHLVARKDFWTLQELTAPGRLKTLAARFKSWGIDANQQHRVLDRLAQRMSKVPATKGELIPLMELEGSELPQNLRGIAAASFLELASAKDLLVRGPKFGPEPTYVSATHWVGPKPTTSPNLASVAQRYANAHFASSAEDFASWLGIGLREARGVWEKQLGEPEPTLWTGLLGPFDPLLHGWKDRTWLLGDNVSKVISTNGVFRPSVICENLCVGLWTYRNGKVELELFAAVSLKNKAKLSEQAVLLSQRLAGNAAD